MIEIDDAGSGSLIGGTGIGIMRTETSEYLFKVIPMFCFREKNFAEKKYQDYVIKIIQFAFKKLNVSKAEPIYVCQGYVFDTLRKWLTHEGYYWQSTKIEGRLQQQVEASFQEYVINLGLPKDFVQHARYAFGFHRLLKWVFADFANRNKLCKTGWKSWMKWSQVPYKIHKSKALKDSYCLKCGKLIKKDSKTVVIKYTTNKQWFVDLHPACYLQTTLRQ